MDEMEIVSFEKFKYALSSKRNKLLIDLTKEELLEEMYTYYKWATTTINSEIRMGDFSLEMLLEREK